MIRSTLILGLISLLLACSQPADFHDTNGNAYRFEDMKGSWVVINYWAEWCAPCVKEIPELAALGDNHEDIVVFGVNYDQPDPETMAAQIAKLKVTFPTFDHDPYQRFGIEKPEVLPTTLILAPDGSLKDVLVGPQTEESLLEEIRS